MPLPHGAPQERTSSLGSDHAQDDPTAFTSHGPGASGPTSTHGSEGGVASPEQVADLGYATLDLDRLARTGSPETVYGAGKTPQQLVGILQRLHTAHPERAILATRVGPEGMAAVREALPADALLLDDEARTVMLGPLPETRGAVGIISAGTSDAHVAAEAAMTVRAHGAAAERVSDVGVAGLHRILANRHRLRDFDCLIVVAGMEGALPSVVGGLTGVPLIAVPTSVGYGASFGGLAALLGMLNSCAPGVVVVNIDNGYGAGVHAARVARQSHPEPPR